MITLSTTVILVGVWMNILTYKKSKEEGIDFNPFEFGLAHWMLYGFFTFAAIILLSFICIKYLP